MENKDFPNQLLARLRSSSSQQSNAPQSNQPSVTSQVTSPTPSGPVPHNPNDVISPNSSTVNTPIIEKSRRSADLLSLLTSKKSEQPASNPPTRQVSAAELVSGFNRKPSVKSVASTSAVDTSSSINQKSSPAASNPQDYLLKLLSGQLKPDVASSSSIGAESKATDSTKAEPGSEKPLSSPPADQKSLLDVFNFPNPYEHPQAVVQVKASPAVTPKPEGLKHSRDTTFDLPASPASKVTKVSGTLGPSAIMADIKVESKSESVDTVPEPVSKAVGEVGEKVEKQVEQALARLHIDSTADDESKASVVGDWQDSAEAKSDPPVSVYALPMKPFTAIDIKPVDTFSNIPKASSFDIAKMRKVFDQVDRNLVTSTTNFIMYALVQEGFRIINRESANYKKYFEGSRDRVFSILAGIGRRTGDDSEVALGVGVNGTVFWASPTKNGTEFAFPPVDSKEEQSAGGPLKTRVKPSWRNTAYFAYARGKSIHIVFPAVAGSAAYTDESTRICDSERYLARNDLKICTGKAAKDFVFSADDTVIASLDKAGRLKFWDIRSLTKAEYNSADGAVADVTTPILTLNTVGSSDKTVPSTIMFIDKEKPMTKGLALRYMVVGLKQNHSIQLWDLALQKAVQQINLPHSEKSDAICSVTFHPRTGVLVIGHPTRNSIYLLHISPPKYTLTTPINQAKYMSMIASSDKALTTIQSTAICNSFREFNLGTRGQLRSLDLMVEPAMNDELRNTLPADQLMTITCTHSKGIFEFVVKRDHLGWGQDGRTLNPIDAENKGAVEIKKLALILGDAGSTGGTSAGDTAVSGKGVDKGKKKKAVETPLASTAGPEPVVRDFAHGPKAIPSPKKGGSAVDPSVAGAKASKASTAPAPVTVAKRGTAPDAPARHQIVTPPMTASIPLTQSAVKAFNASHQPSSASSPRRILDRNTTSGDSMHSANMPAEMPSGVSDMVEAMFKRLSEEKRVSDVTSAAKYDALLRLVSTTLSENFEEAVDKALAKALDVSIQPIQSAVETAANEASTNTVNAVQSAVESAMRDSLLDGRVIRALSDRVAAQVTPGLASQLQQTITGLQTAFTASAKQVNLDTENRLATHIASLESRRLQDAAFFERLTTLVERQAAQIESLSALVRSQSEARHEVDGQRNGLAKPELSAGNGNGTVVQYPVVQSSSHASGFSSYVVEPVVQPTPAVEEKIRSMQSNIRNGKYVEAFIEFLSIEDQTAAFRALVPLGTQILGRVGALLNLSFAAAVTSELVTNVDQRLEWLDAALHHVDPTHNDVKNFTAKVMDTILGRLQASYEAFRGKPHSSEILDHLLETGRMVQEKRDLALHFAVAEGL